MSGTTRTEPPPRAARPGAVVGVAIGLLFLVVTVAQLGFGAFGAVAHEDDLGETLEAVMPAPRPFGLARSGGATLASGDRVLRLRPDVEGEEGADDDGRTALEEVVLSLPKSSAEARSAFEGRAADPMETARKLEEWEREPTDDVVETARGDLEWNSWRAPFVRKRALHADGTWSEATAVNLTTSERALVLTIVWRAETEPSEEELLRVLAGVALAADEPEPASSPASLGASE